MLMGQTKSVFTRSHTANHNIVRYSGVVVIDTDTTDRNSQIAQDCLCANDCETTIGKAPNWQRAAYLTYKPFDITKLRGYTPQLDNPDFRRGRPADSG